MDVEKYKSMMNFAIEAVGNRQFDLDSYVPDRYDLGREFRLRKGLELGSQYFHDEFVGPQQEYVRDAYKALGVEQPATWVKSEICSDLLARLKQRELDL